MALSVAVIVVVAVFAVNIFVPHHVTNGYVDDDDDQWTCPSGTDCIEILNCLPAIMFIRSRGEHPFKRCGWHGGIDLVCCPVESTTTTARTETTKTTTASTTTESIAGTRNTVRPSDTACSQYASGVPLQLNFNILGGEAAKRGEFPHMVALGYMRDQQTLTWECAGSLISDRYVLTAAHCIIRLRPVRLRVGALLLNDTGNNVQDHDVDGAHLHPKYVRINGSNDIALLRTARPVVFSDLVHPACLYTDARTPDVALLITGWGRVESGTAVRASVLQKARVRAFPMRECNETYLQRLDRMLSDGQLCAGSDDASTDSCQGDSGGPLQLFTKRNIYTIVGIVSFGLTDCGGDVPSVYARVYHYLDWIEKIVWP